MVAFLRGMNVGKNHRVKNPELEAIFDSLDLDNAAGFLASGNVVFDVDNKRAKDIDALELRIATKLEAELGYAIPTMVRTGDDVRAIADHEPFPGAVDDGFEGKLQVLLIRDEPDAASANALLDLATDDDLVRVDGRTLYWLPRGNVLESGLEMTALDRITGPATMRTANTMRRITKKYLA